MPVTVGASMQAPPDLASTAILHGVAVPDGFDFNATATRNPSEPWSGCEAHRESLEIQTGLAARDGLFEPGRRQKIWKVAFPVCVNCNP
jgi:hypothetical protein